jgi:pimeloyl-ACP methyl ester carboxylesterase
MHQSLMSRREVIKHALAWSVGIAAGGASLSSCTSAPPPCEPSHDDPAIGWGPNVLAPVFYGYADYGPGVGAPTNLRVYYPSLDGAPHCAPFLAGPGRFPLVLFLHGECSSEKLHYTKWTRLAAVLARSAFIVAIPDLSGIKPPWDLNNATYTLIGNVITWMRASWSHRQFVLGPSTLGIVGHSWGALHGAQLASTIPATAYVSLGGGWTEWPSTPPRPLDTLSVPKLIAWGTAEPLSTLPDPNWTAISSPKHRLVFSNGDHWDYVPPSATSCDTSAGPCELVDDLAADFTAVFLSKYMPPEFAGILPGFIPDNLIPPSVTLTPQQMFFAGSHLTSFGMISAHPGCSATLTWTTPGGSGMRSLP